MLSLRKFGVIRWVVVGRRHLDSFPLRLRTGRIRGQPVSDRPPDVRPGGVRADSRELGGDLVVLNGPSLQEPEIWRVVGVPEFMSKAQMIERGYPNPRGDSYYCLRLEAIPPQHWAGMISAARLIDVRQRVKPGAGRAEPLIATWLDLVR